MKDLKTLGPMTASDSCTTVCKVCGGVCSLISRLHLLSILIKKTGTKRCTNNSLLLRDKTISFLLELIDHMLAISEYVLEKH